MSEEAAKAPEQTSEPAEGTEPVKAAAPAIDEPAPDEPAPAADTSAKKRPPRWRGWARDALIVLAIFFAVHLYRARNAPKGVAPAIAATSVSGQALSLEALRGKPVILYFWATWCGVCKAEQGTIDALAKDHTVLTVASQSGGAAEVRKYMEQKGLTMPAIVDTDGAIAARYGVEAFPSIFIIDPAGKISSVEVGYTTKLGLLGRVWLAGI